MEANLTNITPHQTRSDLYAEALALVNGMKEELASCHTEIGQLKADLHRSEDRCEMLDEERRRHRAESLVFRTKLIELATVQSNIGLMTTTANSIMSTVHELTTEAETPTIEVLDAMERDILPPNKFPDPEPTSVEVVPEGARAIPRQHEVELHSNKPRATM